MPKKHFCIHCKQELPKDYVNPWQVQERIHVPRQLETEPKDEYCDGWGKLTKKGFDYLAGLITVKLYEKSPRCDKADKLRFLEALVKKDPESYLQTLLPPNQQRYSLHPMTEPREDEDLDYFVEEWASEIADVARIFAGHERDYSISDRWISLGSLLIRLTAEKNGVSPEEVFERIK